MMQETVQEIRTDITKRSGATIDVDHQIDLFCDLVATFDFDNREQFAERLTAAWRSEWPKYEAIDRKTASTYLARYRKVLKERFPELKAMSKLVGSSIRMPKAKSDQREGRTPLAQMIEDFVTRVGAMQPKMYHLHLSPAWDKEFAKHSDRTESTQKLYVTKYRKAIMDELGENHLSLKFVIAPQELYDSINRDYRRKNYLKANDLTVIHDWEKVIETGRQMLKEGNPRAKAIGLMIVTGRRPFEVCSTGEFLPAVSTRSNGKSSGKIKHKYLVDFSGQAKTRGSEGTMAGQTFRIPVLAEAPDVLIAYRDMHNHVDAADWRGMDNPTFSKRLNNQLNTMLKRRLAAFWPADAVLTLTCMRALYAEIAYEQFAPSKKSKPAFFAEVLGHRENDLATSLSYMDYALRADDVTSYRSDMAQWIDEAKRAQAEAMGESADDEDLIETDSVIDDGD